LKKSPLVTNSTPLENKRSRRCHIDDLLRRLFPPSLQSREYVVPTFRPWNDMEPNADTVATPEGHQSTCFVTFGIFAVEVWQDYHPYPSLPRPACLQSKAERPSCMEYTSSSVRRLRTGCCSLSVSPPSLDELTDFVRRVLAETRRRLGCPRRRIVVFGAVGVSGAARRGTTGSGGGARRGRRWTGVSDSDELRDERDSRDTSERWLSNELSLSESEVIPCGLR